MIDPPKRTGYCLTYDTELLYDNWRDIGGCSCHTGCTPCSSCHNEGHPISLEENDEAWELDEEVENMARDNITDKSSPPKSKWFNGKYRVTPETSRLLQEAVFKDGGGWWDHSKEFMDLKYDNYWLFVTGDGVMSWSLTTLGLPEKQPPQPAKVEPPKKDLKAAFPPFEKSVDTDVKESKIGTSETYYDTKGKWAVPKEFNGIDLNGLIEPPLAWDFKKIADLETTGNNATTNVGEVNMSNQNRVVSVKFFDDDAGLKAEQSLVAEYQITTRVSDAMTVSKVLLTEDVAGDIAAHNEVRAATVDLHILKQTGNKVMLQAIEFEDLRVEVRQV